MKKVNYKATEPSVKEGTILKAELILKEKGVALLYHPRGDDYASCPSLSLCKYNRKIQAWVIVNENAYLNVEESDIKGFLKEAKKVTRSDR